MYSVELSQQAQKFLEKLGSQIKERIEEKLKRLSREPISSDSKFIYRDNADKVFRFRIGDFRALYKVKDKEKIVLIAKIDKRKRIYD